MEKYCKTRSRSKKFREINSLVKALIWRKKCWFSIKIVIALFYGTLPHCVGNDWRWSNYRNFCEINAFSTFTRIIFQGGTNLSTQLNTTVLYFVIWYNISKTIFKTFVKSALTNKSYVSWFHELFSMNRIVEKKKFYS